MSTTGTYQNTLTATVQGTAISVQFSGFARYSFASHVNPIFSAAGCTGCHTGAGTSGLVLSGTSAQNYSALVNVSPVCDASLGTLGYRRVSTIGGDSGVNTYSIIMRLVDASLTSVGTCGDGGSHGTKVSGTNLTILRSWVRNSAPNN
jgi:hypothetical protein